ncbi:phage head closure protein [Ureibacillus sp. 179-F W5.1 NHS]|uniref:phage head closure protein n=1 Tax=Ureibacillus sp. 179-F W5.1 NHS TaxID=3374297 RepID=UPI003879BE8A
MWLPSEQVIQLVNKVLRETFNDGILIYGQNKTKLSNTKKQIGKEFIQEGTLAFSELSAREQDYSFVDAMSRTLDLKLKTMYPPVLRGKLSNDYTVRIDNVEYNTVKIDRDSNNPYLYWYLQRVGVVNE